MHLTFSYTTEQKINSLSKRLVYLAKERNTYKEHNDQHIKCDNLKHNLSVLISKIILNLTLSKETELLLFKPLRNIIRKAAHS